MFAAKKTPTKTTTTQLRNLCGEAAGYVEENLAKVEGLGDLYATALILFNTGLTENDNKALKSEVRQAYHDLANAIESHEAKSALESQVGVPQGSLDDAKPKVSDTTKADRVAALMKFPKRILVPAACTLLPEQTKTQVRKLTNANLAEKIASSPEIADALLAEHAPKTEPKADEPKARDLGKCSTDGCDKPAMEEEDGKLVCSDCGWGESPEFVAKRKAAERRKAEQAKRNAAGGSRSTSAPRRALNDEATKACPIAIKATYKGTTWDGALQASGQVIVDGTSYTSPSKALNVLTGNAANGWRIWRVEREGKWAPIDCLRAQPKGYQTSGLGRNTAEQRAERIAKKAAVLEKAEARVATLKADLKEMVKEDKALAKEEDKAKKAADKAAAKAAAPAA